MKKKVYVAHCSYGLTQKTSYIAESMGYVRRVLLSDVSLILYKLVCGIEFSFSFKNCSENSALKSFKYKTFSRLHLGSLNVSPYSNVMIMTWFPYVSLVYFLFPISPLIGRNVKKRRYDPSQQGI